MPTIDSLVFLDQAVVLQLQTTCLSPIFLSLFEEFQEGPFPLIALLDLSPKLLVDVLDSLVVIVELVVFNDQFLVVLGIDILIHLLEGLHLVLIDRDLLAQLLHNFFLGV